MAYLPPEALTLTGGCHCRSVRYTINVPALGDRQLLPGTVDTRIQRSDGTGPNGEGDDVRVPTRIPVISLDHCGDCRHSVGSIVQSWLICPVDWVDWTFAPRAPSSDDHQEPVQKNTSSEVKRTTLQVCAPRSAEADDDDDVGTSYVTRYVSSPNVARMFCKSCGTHLTYFAADRSGYHLPPLVDVAVGSLDDECLARVQPERHLWWDFGIAWVEDLFRNGKVMNRHSDGSLLQEIRD